MLANVAASTVSPSFAYETAAVSVLSAVAVTVMVARVLGAVIRDAIGVAGDLHERVLVRAGSVERQLVESDSAIGCVRGSARHPPRTQPQGERLRFARHRRRDRIRHVGDNNDAGILDRLSTSKYKNPAELST